MIRRLFINEAYCQALKSEMNFNHGSVLIYRGRIIGKGFNSYHDSNYKEEYSLHAEISAINNALKKIHVNDLKKCELVIIRINKNGDFLNSKPCDNCARIIKNYNIKKIFYS